MTVWKTVFASIVLATLGYVVLAELTEGYQAFTTEGIRRERIVSQHPEVPNIVLETHTGRTVRLTDFRGQWLLVDFIYTRCMTYCLSLGAEFSFLQRELHSPIIAGKLHLLSVSFDPLVDSPSQLQGYLQRFESDGNGWLAARPTNQANLSELTKAFSLTVIPDEFGGFVHNTGIVLINPEGKMVAVFDQGDPNAVVRALRGYTGL